MYCPQCGQKLLAGETGCPVCETTAPTAEEMRGSQNGPFVQEIRKHRKNIWIAVACSVGLFVLMVFVAGVGFAVGWKGTKVAEWVVSVLWCCSGFVLVALLKERKK